MKQPAKKSNALSLVPPAAEPDLHEPEKTAGLRESFEGWLNSVAPTLLQSTLKERSEVRPTRRSLTSNDITRVNRATVRESNAHRHWPPEVVISFLEADVIKPGKR